MVDRIGLGEEVLSAKKHKPEGKDEKSFYIINGGLILLWPFLPKFFRSLELTADRKFIDQKSQVKAIHMLQYLASGEQSTYEYVMVLNKVLCGYPIGHSFSSKIEFTDHEIEEAEELLHSVINQLEVLKSTSVQGLRQSFIQRNARLTGKSDQWELQVESKGFDMLLDKLPWGISVARLPWMKKPIYVDWR
ncbi:MAG: contractile injection system tape measure protein [Balneolaceae bacterium]|nr:contractile injection system tape measure protein [Balneolaceae bacterium]